MSRGTLSRCHRDVVQRFVNALGTENVNTGIAQIKLGRVLLRENPIRE